MMVLMQAVQMTSADCFYEESRIHPFPLTYVKNFFQLEKTFKKVS